MKNLLSLLIIVFFFLSIITAKAQNTKQSFGCEEVLNATIKSWGPSLINSGTGINDLGSYQNCKKNSSNAYYLLRFKAGLLFNIGLCVPNTCTASQLNQSLYEAIQMPEMQPYINFPANGISDFGIVDPNVEPEKGVALYVALMVYCTAIILVIAGTFVKFLRGDDSGNAKIQQVRIQDFESSRSNTSIITNDGNLSHDESLIIVKNSKFIKFLECFDLKSNLLSIFETKEPRKSDSYDSNLNIFNGARTLSFYYVIFGHVYFIHMSFISNPESIQPFTVSSFFLVLVDGFYAVDVFFFLSGFLVAFILIRKLRKMPANLKTYCGLILHRWIRIWPAYVAAILFFWKLSGWLGSGPLWIYAVSNAQKCDGIWWKNFLFVDNLLNTQGLSDYCFGWGWYLAADMQMFIATPFIIWTYIKKPKFGLILTWVILICCSLIGIMNVILTNFPYSTIQGENGNPEQWQWFYVFPITRSPPYIYGLILAMLYNEYQSDQEYSTLSNLKRSRSARFICVLIGLIILNFLSWFPRTDQLNTVTWNGPLGYCWQAFSRLFWVIGLSLTLLPSLLGEYPIIKKIMDNGFFTVGAKVSFSGYLVHLIVLTYILFTQEGLVMFNNLNFFALFLLGVFMTYMGAIILMVLIEYPMANVVSKILFPRRGEAVSNKSLTEPVKPLLKLNQSGIEIN